MTLTTLATLALKTLAAQQKYFKSREREDLIASKELEKQLRVAADSALNMRLDDALILTDVDRIAETLNSWWEDFTKDKDDNKSTIRMLGYDKLKRELGEFRNRIADRLA